MGRGIENRRKVPSPASHTLALPFPRLPAGASNCRGFHPFARRKDRTLPVIYCQKQSFEKAREPPSARLPPWPNAPVAGLSPRSLLPIRSALNRNRASGFLSALFRFSLSFSSAGTSSFESVEDETCNQFWIKVGAFRGHPFVEEAELFDVFNRCRQHERGQWELVRKLFAVIVGKSLSLD
jgi:hypothetical protein